MSGISILQIEKSIGKLQSELVSDGFKVDVKCFRTRKEEKSDGGVSRCVMNVKNDAIDETFIFLANGYHPSADNTFGGDMKWSDMKKEAKKKLVEKIVTDE